jgi:tryptophan 2,3-dioxygenase
MSQHHDATLDFSKSLSYGDHLHLDQVRSAQHPRSPDHIETLFNPLGEALADLEDAFRLWRLRHVTTVERIIGFKRGTGGTNGVSYLRKMLDVVLFPEIWSLRTAL